MKCFPRRIQTVWICCGGTSAANSGFLIFYLDAQKNPDRSLDWNCWIKKRALAKDKLANGDTSPSELFQIIKSKNKR